MKRFFIITQPVLILLTSLFLNFCGGIGGGGGGGSSSPSEPASVLIDASPRVIDSGDRTAVTVDIRDVNDLGIALKLRYPSGLDYVVGSAHIEVNGKTFSAISEGSEKTSGSVTYLVFYFSKDIFGDNSGTLTLTLQGNSAVDSIIEVDADIDDPTLSNNVEFNISDPKFDAQDSTSIEVKDSSSSGTSTPTETATP
jgi:hypothetical protein